MCLAWVFLFCKAIEVGTDSQLVNGIKSLFQTVFGEAPWKTTLPMALSEFLLGWAKGVCGVGVKQVSC